MRSIIRKLGDLMNRKTIRRVTLSLATALFLCAAPSQIHALLASIKSIGMAATATSYPLDSLSAAYNPAGIAFLCDRIDVGVACDHTPQRARLTGSRAPIPHINRQYNASRLSYLFGGELGAIKTINCNMAIGLAVYNKDFNKTTYSRPIPLLGTSCLGGEYLHEVAAATFAIKVRPCLSLGASLNYHVQRIKLNGLQMLDNLVFSSNPGHVTNRGYNYAHGFGASFGALWKATSWLSLGASYQTKARMSRFHKYSGFVAHKGRLDIPQIITAGVSVKPFQKFTFACDYQYVDWKQIPPLHNPILPNAFTSKLGKKDGAGFGVRSQSFWRFGVEWQCLRSLALRAGFRHANSLIPHSQTAINTLSCDAAHDFATCGATWDINCHNELSFFYAHGFKSTNNGKNSIPAQLGGGEVDLNQQKNLLGLAYSYKF